MVLRSCAGRIEISSSFSASEGPKVGLRSGIGITLCSQPLKEEGSLIQWMLESGVSRSHEKGSSRALSF